MPCYVTFLFTLLKYFIHNARLHNKKPVIRYFKKKIWFHVNAMHTVHKINNKEKMFFSRFGFLFDKANHW